MSSPIRKFRYANNRGSAGKKRAIGQFVKFLVGWNIFGYLFYRHLKDNGRKLDQEGPEAFDKRSEWEQFMIIKHVDPSQMTHYKVSPTSIEKQHSKGPEMMSEETKDKDREEVNEMVVSNQEDNFNTDKETIAEPQTNKEGYTSTFYQSAKSVSSGIFSLSWFRKGGES